MLLGRIVREPDMRGIDVESLHGVLHPTLAPYDPDGPQALVRATRSLNAVLPQLTFCKFSLTKTPQFYQRELAAQMMSYFRSNNWHGALPSMGNSSMLALLTRLAGGMGLWKGDSKVLAKKAAKEKARVEAKEQEAQELERLKLQEAKAAEDAKQEKAKSRWQAIKSGGFAAAVAAAAATAASSTGGTDTIPTRMAAEETPPSPNHAGRVPRSSKENVLDFFGAASNLMQRVPRPSKENVLEFFGAASAAVQRVSSLGKPLAREVAVLPATVPASKGQISFEVVEVKLNRKGHEKLGLVLDDGNSVVMLREGTPAALCGQIKIGDEITEIEGAVVSQERSVTTLLQELPVTPLYMLKIKRPKSSLV